jgi:DNA-binding CsgD family transcriptional regulator
VVEAVLFGREREMRVIEDELRLVNDRGSALLIYGEPGVGKSSILAAAKSLAAGRNVAVLSATGVQSETNLPFAGLYDLLRPIIERAKRLPGPQQSALLGAFGLVEAAAPELFLIALAALDLVVEFATEQPLLLVVDDVQWLDESSTSVLTFIARRIASEPIFLLISSREVPGAAIGDILPELRVGGLNERAAAALLEAHFPGLPVAVRDRVISESAGNPLALVELPKTITSEFSGQGLLPGHLPITMRLERAFTSRLANLPATTRQLLLVAAISDRSSVAEILSATSIVCGATVSLEALTPALTRGLLQADNVSVRFTHSLVRSAVHAAATIAERVAAHTALATVVQEDPDRRAWHRAAATVGTDDAVAEDLESAAARAQVRGDARAAIQALARAAQLSTDAKRRARCLIVGAELALDIGWSDVVERLLEEAETLDLGAPDRVRLMWFREASARSISGSRALTEIADNIKTNDDADLALDLLSGPATRGWWAEPDEQVCNHVIAAVGRVRIVDDDPRFLLIVSMTDPINRGAFVIERLSNLVANNDGNGRAARLLGIAATQVGACDLARPFLDRAAASLRSEGRLALWAGVLVLRAWSAIYLADRNVAIADAEEAARLASETKQPIWLSEAQAAEAMLAALRGDHETADALAADAERTALPTGTLPAEVQMARGMNALGAGRYDDAYRQFHRMFDPNDSASHPMRHCYYIGDLAEAAVQSGQRDAAEAILAEMEELAGRTPSPQFHLAIHHARAVLATDRDAERLFEAALAADVLRSPFAKARLQLAFGTWLRRARRPREARVALQAALEAFDFLGAAPWGGRARQELRAAGVSTGQRTPQRRERLTAQELQIALMAAEGLTNRDIGEKLYLSPRTVGSHLYRLFPKLSITSRHQLRDALASEQIQSSDASRRTGPG